MRVPGAGFVRQTRRLFARRPAFCIAVVATLALGVGTATAMFSLFNTLLIRPLPVPHGEQVVMFGLRSRQGQTSPFVSYPLVSRWRSLNGVHALSAVLISDQTFVTPTQTRLVEMARVEPDWFRVMNVRPLRGRTLTAGDSANTVIVSYRFWQHELGGRPDVLHTTITLDNVPCVVVGVMPESFTFPSVTTDLWRPLVLNPQIRAAAGAFWALAFARLDPGHPVAEVRAEANTTLAGIARRVPVLKGHRATLVTLRTHLLGSVDRQLHTLGWAALLVLAIACVNVATLFMARAEERASELAIRVALGARTRDLVAEMTAEVLALGMLGGAAGLLLASWMANGLWAVARHDALVTQLHLAHVPFDALVFLFGLGLSLALSLAVSLVTVRLALRRHAADAVRVGPGAGGRPRARRLTASVIAESALALALLTTAGLLMRTVWNLNQQNLGFAPEHVLSASLRLLPEAHRSKRSRDAVMREILSRVRAAPGVVQAGATLLLFFNEYARPVPLLMRGASQQEHAAYRAMVDPVSPGYFQTLRVPLVSGRFFSGRDRLGSQPVVLVNQVAARQLWPGRSPLGQQVGLRAAYGRSVTWRTVVGVVGNMRRGGLDHPYGPQLFVPLAQASPMGGTVVVRSTLTWAATIETLRAVVHRVDPTTAVWEASPLETQIDDSLGARRFEARLLIVFAVLAVLLCLAGAYGLMQYLVACRSRELALRLALGASRGSVAGLVVRQALRLGGLGIACGLALSVGIGWTVRSTLFGVTPLDPATYLVAAALLLMACLLAALGPAARAMKMDPIAILKAE